MTIETKIIGETKLNLKLRCPNQTDALALSKLRLVIDEETEYLDREPGECYLSAKDFEEVISDDLKEDRKLFLIAEVDNKIVGYARCIGKELSRFRHQAEFGICILKNYWGYGIGKQLISNIVDWADNAGIEKITLTVVEENTKAINLYKQYGFVEEGLLIRDRKHKDGHYYNTLIMARFNV